LQELDPRCIILTSGTLSPLDEFSNELKANFPIKLENPHVIKKIQAKISILNKGIDGNTFDFSYSNRDSESMISDLGRSIAKLAEVTPGGILMFFPSYSLMHKIYEFWERKRIDKEIEKWKSLLLEPKESCHYPQVISAFYNDVYTKGSVFMGVCRGKVAEGLDFSDNAARAVVIVGVPFPLKVDPRTIMKQYYLDEIVTKSKYAMNSHKWYLMQATRATNQAIGRVIRHAEDYGNIILMDQRFGDPQNKDSISKWLRGQLTEYSDFNQAIKDYSDFYAEMKSQNFVPKVDRLEKIMLEFNEVDDDSNNNKIKHQIETDSHKQKADIIKKERLKKKEASKLSKAVHKIALNSVENTSSKNMSKNGSRMSTEKPKTAKKSKVGKKEALV
jgi:regulator of telomere elongation helicase 1